MVPCIRLSHSFLGCLKREPWALKRKPIGDFLFGAHGSLYRNTNKWESLIWRIALYCAHSFNFKLVARTRRKNNISDRRWMFELLSYLPLLDAAMQRASSRFISVCERRLEITRMLAFRNASVEGSRWRMQFLLAISIITLSMFRGIHQWHGIVSWLVFCLRSRSWTYEPIASIARIGKELMCNLCASPSFFFRMLARL